MTYESSQRFDNLAKKTLKHHLALLVALVVIWTTIVTFFIEDHAILTIWAIMYFATLVLRTWEFMARITKINNIRNGR